ncbi:dolichyl-phosphate beta-glucosyltransferase [Haliangium sp.]|uniref:dolichyl-phosphate beta-glucosyltransferase n=1 Tax=Haliangium sp. TaxID=2663208 RepID=UPI003D0CD42E
MTTPAASAPSPVEIAYPDAVPSGAGAVALSVVIPAYDEADRIEPYLDSIQRYFDRGDEQVEVLVVDDGSRDRTAALVRARMSHDPRLGLVQYPNNRGKGHAVRVGMRAARGRLRLFADADGSTPIAEVERLRAAIAAGADVAIGSRALPAADIRRVIKPHRRVIGETFRVLRRLFLRVDIVDSQCGFKLFTSEAAAWLYSVAKVDGFAFDVELLYLASRAGMTIREVPVNWYDSSVTRVNLLLDPAKMMRDVLRIRRLHRDTPIPAPGHW